MTAFQPAYRVTIYAPRSTDATETTALTPVSGAVHSDAFKVSSIGGVTGFQPYMAGPPTGENDNVTLPDLKVSVGQYSFDLLDKRTSTDNLQRWVTAFVGNSSGSVRLKGRRVLIEESIDNGSTWGAYFVGRISDFSLTEPLFYRISVRSTIEDLKTNIFNAIPSVSYVNFQTLLPVGMYKPLGVIEAVTPLRGAYTTDVAFINEITDYAVDNEDGTIPDVIKLDKTSLGRADNFISSDIMKVNAKQFDMDGVQQYGNAYAYITTNTGATGRMNVANLWSKEQTKAAGKEKYSEASVIGMIVKPLDPSEPDYISSATFRSASYVDVAVIGSTALDNEESKRAAIWLDNVHPVQVWKDILDGKFGMYINNAPQKTYGYDVTRFDALIADKSIPNARFKITKPWKALDFIEQAICKPYSLGYATQPSASGGTYVAAIVPFKTTIPTAVPTASLTVTDVVTTEVPEWETSAPITNMQLVWYTDSVSNFAKQKENATTNNETFNISKESDHPLIFLDNSDPDAPPSSLKIEANGIRGQLQEPSSGSTTVVGQDSNLVAERVAKSLLQPYFQRYSSGTPAVRVTCRRTSTVNSLNIGDWTLVNVDMLPNQGTHLRGGNRVMQVVGKSTSGPNVMLRLIDGAINNTMAVPSINSVVANSSLTNNAVNVSVTTTENARVVVQYAVTVTGSSQPSSGDGGWTYGNVAVVNATTQTIYIDRLPSGVAVWVRVRAESVATNDVKIPSAWAYATALNLTALLAPTGLSVSHITSKSAKLTWTPTARAKVEVRLASPPSASMNSVVVLPSGSTSYTLRGLDLDASPSHSVGIRHIDGMAGKSLTVSASFVASGSADQLPDLGEIIVYFGDTV